MQNILNVRFMSGVENIFEYNLEKTPGDTRLICLASIIQQQGLLDQEKGFRHFVLLDLVQEIRFRH